MEEEINRRLAGLRDRLASKRRLEASLEDARTSLEYHRARLFAHTQEKEQEQRDIDRLEIVDYDFPARARHRECTDAIASCEAETSRLYESLVALGDVESLYLAAIYEKEQAIVASQDPPAYQLTLLAREIATLLTERREATAREQVASPDDRLTALRAERLRTVEDA